jgi:hypothetical protein
MPHVFERAPTGRAKCRACGANIPAGDVRFGERLPNPFAEGENVEMTHWFHVRCAAFKRPDPFVEALDAPATAVLLGDDRALLEREARLGLEHRRLARVDGASRAPSNRAACRACKNRIERDAWRIALVWYEDGRFVPSGYIHLGCAAAYLETSAVIARLRHFSPSLGDTDLAQIEAGLVGQGGPVPGGAAAPGSATGA